MATFKHISSKNADYGAAEQYLTFEHDEFTMKPTLDKNGQIVPRTGYLISSLNCGGEDFAIACMRSNLKYGKNQKQEDVKSHHYIISFDPRDVADNGLSVDRAQELGEQFCKEHFSGHQALVCTHPDGHNHSGNIHVHIVINSLRIAEVLLLPYMERPADTREGCKSKIDAILENNQIYKNEVSRSGNLVIDSLINYKYSLALKEGVYMKCYVFVPEQMSFDGADLCIILGNLLDNAMEAAGSLPEGQRHMEVSVSQIKGSLSIMVQNPYEGKVTLNGKGQILTSKPDSLNHGIGLSSVQRSVDKYNGELLTDYGEGIFKATVLLYPPENLHDDS